jgi:hypothetical protein
VGDNPNAQPRQPLQDPADRRILATHLLDLLDAAVGTLGPQCETASAAGVRCVLDAGHNGLCDVEPHPRLAR